MAVMEIACAAPNGDDDDLHRLLPVSIRIIGVWRIG